MNTIAEIQRINQQELDRGIAGTSASWHAQYSASAWIHVGNLDISLTEGDVLVVLSQFGEIEDLHLVREEETGKSKGFAFCKYQDARSCVLAVDNLIGTKVCGRSLRVDHVENYRLPKHLLEKQQEDDKKLGPGHAYAHQELSSEFSLQHGQDLFAPPPASAPDHDDVKRQAKRQRKQERQRKRQEKEERRRRRELRKSEKEERKREKRARGMPHDGSSEEAETQHSHKKRRRHRSESSSSDRHHHRSSSRD